MEGNRERTWKTMARIRQDEARTRNRDASAAEESAAELRRRAREVLSRPARMDLGVQDTVRMRLELEHRERIQQEAEELMKRARALESKACTQRQLGFISARSSSIFERLERRVQENETRRRKLEERSRQATPVNETLLRSWPRAGE